MWWVVPGAGLSPSQSLPLQWDEREIHKGKRVKTDGGTESFTGKAKAAGARPSQTVTAAQHRQVLKHAQESWAGMTNTITASPLLPPSPALRAEHGAVQFGTSLGQWGLSCAPSQLPVSPSPVLATGTEQSWALCRPSPAEPWGAVSPALGTNPSTVTAESELQPSQTHCFEKNFCMHFTFSNHPVLWDACGLLGQVTAISGEWILGSCFGESLPIISSAENQYLGSTRRVRVVV